MDMNRIRKQNILEQSIYWTLWAVVFLIPLIGNLISEKTTGDQSLAWKMLAKDWLKTLPFFVLFLANNYVLMPYLFMRKKYVHYIIFALLLTIGLCCYSQAVRPFGRETFDMRKNEMMMKNIHPSGPGPRMNANPHPEDGPEGDAFMDMDKPDHQPPLNMMKGHIDDKGPALPHVMSLLVYFAISLLLLGFNIAVRMVFQSFRDEERMKDLEKEKLNTELQYLRYQVNPHFFMNTLNNIHALVDIDTEKAKSSIIELSKLMRYVLYEANNTKVLLSKELQFLDNYVTLMRLRFTDKVHLEVEVPQMPPEVQVPPLLFVTFLENAFKHGVSYQKDSYIRLKLQVDDENKKIIFFCSNSNLHKVEDEHHGIGLENVNKRLKLIYGEDYTLSINDNKEKDIFEVLLIIPM